MMIFIRLNIHKHNLDANINLNNAIIIMFPYDYVLDIYSDKTLIIVDR